MDSIREPLLVVCMVIVVGGMFTMASLIVTLVIKGARKGQSPSAPSQTPPVAPNERTARLDHNRMAQTVSS